MERPLLPFLRVIFATPLMIYAILTAVGVIYDAERGVLTWHPDALLIFEVIGLTFCAYGLVWVRKK